MNSIDFSQFSRSDILQSFEAMKAELASRGVSPPTSVRSSSPQDKISTPRQDDDADVEDNEMDHSQDPAQAVTDNEMMQNAPEREEYTLKDKAMQEVAARRKGKAQLKAV
jgi:hypothetical protein